MRTVTFDPLPVAWEIDLLALICTGSGMTTRRTSSKTEIQQPMFLTNHTKRNGGNHLQLRRASVATQPLD
jgi:hypothetical protein